MVSRPTVLYDKTDIFYKSSRPCDAPGENQEGMFFTMAGNRAEFDHESGERRAGSEWLEGEHHDRAQRQQYPDGLDA
jgi:hypothetical protein